MVDTTTALIILTVSAFIPPLLFLGWVRGTERYGREPWRSLLRTFLWGAVFAVILGVILTVAFLFLYQVADRVWVLSGRFGIQNLELLVLAIVIAPIAEEFAKGIGVYLARPIIDEPEDGLIYGAASGLGFAASENLLYAVAFLLTTGELATSLFVIGIRSVSSALLHAAASAAYGYGIGLARIWPGRFRAFPYYVLAVVMHSLFNLLASIGEWSSQTYGEVAASITLAAAAILAIGAFTAIRVKITREDARRVRW